VDSWFAAVNGSTVDACFFLLFSSLGAVLIEPPVVFPLFLWTGGEDSGKGRKPRLTRQQLGREKDMALLPVPAPRFQEDKRRQRNRSLVNGYLSLSLIPFL
jgi:hypothetical protein